MKHWNQTKEVWMDKTFCSESAWYKHVNWTVHSNDLFLELVQDILSLNYYDTLLRGTARMKK